jgi:flagellar biogenesis protein FliO
MNTDALIGASLLFLALGIILFVLFWSRRIIRFIHKNKLNSAREILKKLHEKH